MKDNREQQIVEAISEDGFTYKGVLYKSMTPRMLLLLEKFNSPFYYGGSQLRGLMDFLYIASNDPKEIARIPITEFEERVFEYSDTFTSEDLGNLGKLASEWNERNAATMVEVRDTTKKK